MSQKILSLPIYGNNIIVEAILKDRMVKIKGSAIHPVATQHPNEWLKVRRYIEEFLEKAAPTLTGKPLTIDHQTAIPNSKVTSACWNSETSSVDYEAIVPEEIAELIREGKIKGVSVGIDWMQPAGGIISTPQGFVPFNFVFDELALCQHLSPGDPLSSIQLWESILPKAETVQSIGKPLKPPLDEPFQMPADTFTELSDEEILAEVARAKANRRILERAKTLEEARSAYDFLDSGRYDRFGHYAYVTKHFYGLTYIGDILPLSEVQEKASAMSIRQVKERRENLKEEIEAYKTLPQRLREEIERDTRSMYPHFTERAEEIVEEIYDGCKSNLEKVAKAIPFLEEIKEVYDKRVAVLEKQLLQIPDLIKQANRAAKAVNDQQAKIAKFLTKNTSRGVAPRQDVLEALVNLVKCYNDLKSEWLTLEGKVKRIDNTALAQVNTILDLPHLPAQVYSMH